MPKGRIPGLAVELKELFRRFPRAENGRFGIALGGAHAKGIEDSDSDLDIYIFAGDVPGNDERSEIAAKFDRRISKVVSWSGGEPFEQAGTDFYFEKTRVECWFRSLAFIESAIGDGREGRIRREFTAWNPTGFHYHCTLSDLCAMKPLADPAGILAGWKADVAEYPPKLRSAIISEFLPQAGFWPRNFHYISAVERRDALYCSAIVQQVVHHLIQVLFALNRAYFPGDKKLREALDLLPLIPSDSGRRVEAMIMPAADPGVDDFRRQRTMLVEYYDEVKDLVGRYGG